jgi:hypothetical protein
MRYLSSSLVLPCVGEARARTIKKIRNGKKNKKGFVAIAIFLIDNINKANEQLKYYRITKDCSIG